MLALNHSEVGDVRTKKHSTTVSRLPCGFPLGLSCTSMSYSSALFKRVSDSTPSLPGTTSSAAFVRCLGELSN